MNRPTMKAAQTIMIVFLIIFSFIIIGLVFTSKSNKSYKTRASTNREQRALVGVRHFPSYISGNHQIRNAQEQLLASGGLLEPPQSWRDRWPYFTVIRAEDTIDIHEDDQRVIDQEIQLLSKAGVDYWALEVDWVENEASNYNYALHLYNSSQYKNLLKFSLIVTSETLKNSDWNGSYLNNIVNSLKDNQYVKTTSGRPILYMWRFDTLTSEMGESSAKQRMKDFVSAIKLATSMDPYIVMMDLGSKNMYDSAGEFSANARTSYLGRSTSCGIGGSYNNIIRDNLVQWNEEGVVSNPDDIDYIPLLTVGMDPRPKSFDKILFDYGKNQNWCEKGTPQQIANNLKQALTWVKTHKNRTTEPNTVLIAAWADISESGWLVPTIEEGNARLNAISTILGGEQIQTPASPYTQSDPPRHQKGTLSNLIPTDNSTLNSNRPFLISALAPMAARVKLILRGPNRYEYTQYFINGKGPLPVRKFSVEMPPVPPGGPYVLTIVGVAENPINNDFAYERKTELNFISL